MNQEQFETNVLQWADDRNIPEGGTVDGQLDKLQEECQEVVEAVHEHYNSSNSKDLGETLNDIILEIGDVKTVLVILEEMLGIDPADTRELAWNKIKDRKGRIIDGTFVKEEDLPENL